MSQTLATLLVRAFYVQLALGLALLPWWHVRGLARLDRAAAHASFGMRALITPGLLVLWPWLLARAWRGGGEPRPERNAHRALLEGEP